MALSKRFKPSLWQGLDALAYYVLFPALIFSAAATSAVTLQEVGSLGVLVWSLLIAGCVIAWPLVRLSELSYTDFAGVWQTTWRFNSGLAFVVAQALPGDALATMAVIVGLAVPVANILAVLVLSHRSDDNLVARIKIVLRNPFFIASATGITASVLGAPLPEIPMQALSRIGSVAPVLILIVIGAALDWRMLLKLRIFDLGLHTVKLLILPAMAMALVTVAALSPYSAAAFIVFAALPTATAAPTLASQFGADKKRVATVTVQSTMLSLGTLPFWLLVIS